jgi:hypothetical protein
MEGDYRHYTVTMARLYAGQGHWDKAAEIYRHILGAEGGREELAAALAEAERNARAAVQSKAADLVPLFERWIDLLTRYERVRRLRRRLERSRLSGGTPWQAVDERRLKP